MTTGTLTLAEFLLARIAEDEAKARKAGGVPWYAEHLDGAKSGDDPRWILDSTPSLVSYEMTTEANALHAEAWNPARVLAECEAKRRIVEGVLGYLATPYADHPDYREEWRP